MSEKPLSRRRFRDKIDVTVEATVQVVRALLRHRMGLVLPMVLVLLLAAYVGMILGLVSPFTLLPRSAQVTPFIYPLF
jgi:hypothetical protein